MIKTGICSSSFTFWTYKKDDSVGASRPYTVIYKTGVLELFIQHFTPPLPLERG